MVSNITKQFEVEKLNSPLTYSSSVTLCLTHDCPWSCGYCGFRTRSEGLISDENISLLLKQAKVQGAKEALIISGENPFIFPHIQEALKERGHSDFIDFANAVAARALRSGLLPHCNLGALSANKLKRLRPYHASMGLMLENIEYLRKVAPQKNPKTRLDTIRQAGKLSIPFTSGILIGVGESHSSRLRSLKALADLYDQYHHLQEILIQNYIPNKDSKIDQVQIPLSEYLELIRYWRNVCPDVPIQIPPNLNPYLSELLPYIDDLGGISMNRDEVNQASPWSQVSHYESLAHSSGRSLRERLAIYPKYISQNWIDPKLYSTVKLKTPRPLKRSELWSLPIPELTQAAQELNLKLHNNHVTFVINRNANFTNICNVGCSFCGFQRTKNASDAYTRSIDEIIQRLYLTPQITEVCIQGGINPDIPFTYYTDLLKKIRNCFPHLHIHAFSPMEIHSLHLKTGLPYQSILARFLEAGLNSIPGTAAEILVDEVRQVISGNKLDSKTWTEIIRTAHTLGLPSTATIMIGHIETWQHIETHFQILKSIQEETGGFSEFIPLTFVPYKNALGRRMRQSSHSPTTYDSNLHLLTLEKARRLYPLARLFFAGLIDNLQTSWVKLGKELALDSLDWGCNDFGGTLFEESITRESGGKHGEAFLAKEIISSLRARGKLPVQRNTLYQTLRQFPHTPLATQQVPQIVQG
ncbi:MAG: 5-amino-6-(D-ribitylamino)uracil--L-tyrosine 4-hydroxyphenyl transferase CofH [Verrucomicrobiota bacterium]